MQFVYPRRPVCAMPRAGREARRSHPRATADVCVLVTQSFIARVIGVSAVRPSGRQLTYRDLASRERNAHPRSCDKWGRPLVPDEDLLVCSKPTVDDEI
jgi:hypothetical protein